MHDKLSDTGFPILVLYLCLPSTPSLNLFPKHLQLVAHFPKII